MRVSTLTDSYFANTTDDGRCRRVGDNICGCSMTIEEQALFGIDKLNIVRLDVPAVTHVDYSARIQTVHANTDCFTAYLSGSKN